MDVYTGSMGIYTDSTDVHRSRFPYISTQGRVVHRGTSEDVSMVNMVVRGRMNVYDE